LFRRAGALVIATLLASPVLACVTPPASLTLHHTDLIANSEVIVLARVTGEANGATYDTLDVFQGPPLYERPLAQFETVENLRGNTPRTFSLSGGSLAGVDYDVHGDFDRHREAVFWDKKMTRQWNDVDCRMYPEFQIGRTYLLFIDQPHWRAYEEIRADDDLWLAAVRRVLADPTLWSGLALGLKDWLSLSRGVFVGRIESCDGPTLTVDEVLFGAFSSTWRYSTADDAEYWLDDTCTVGQQYLVIATRDEPEILPHYSATALPVHDGLLDFGPAFRESDVDVQAFRIQKLDAVRTLFEPRPKQTSTQRDD